MADQQSIVALNIGSQRISMGVFVPTKKGIILKGCQSANILADPATEAGRIPQVQMAITELAKALKVGTPKAAYALSGNSVFVRFVKLPPLEDENMAELVRFEAQQNVPFPIDEVVWDWEKIETGGIETEVVLVAVKADSLNDLNAVVAETGLGTQLVDCAPTALYNAYCYNYPASEESVLLLDVGAKTTNLIYAEGKKFFTRSVTIGGANVTSAIAKEYNASFADAENSKLTSGLVVLGGGHAGQLDEPTAALGMVIRNALTRLTAEIQRTTTLFRSQHGGNAPQKVLLAGGSASLPYLREFLEEKLSVPVEFFNPLQRISFGKGIDVDAVGREAHQLGELVGLGLRATGKAEVEIDLVPDVVQAQRDINRRKPALIAAAALLIVGLGAWAGFKAKSVGESQKFLASLDDKMAELQASASKIERTVKDEKSSLSLIKAYAAAEEGRLSFVNTWNQISAPFLSEKVWITDLEFRAEFDATNDVKTSGVIDESYTGATYGASVMRDDRETADSVSIKGLHLDSQNEVYAIFEKLRSVDLLSFKWKEEELKQSQLVLTNKAAPNKENDEYAAPFEFVIPLKKTISLKSAK